MGGAGAAGEAAGGAGNEFAGLGIDPNMDPELAMALRLSMEEARAHEAANNPEPAANAEAAGAASGT